jgi:hypothetical protein
MEPSSTEKGERQPKSRATASRALIWIGVAFAILLNAILVIGRYGGAIAAFTNAANIALMIGILFGGALFSAAAGLAIWAIVKLVSKKRVSLILFMSVAYLSYSVLNLIPRAAEEARVTVEGHKLTVNGSLQMSFNGSPKSVSDGKKGMASFMWNQGDAVEIMTAMRITRALLRIEQQYQIMEGVLDGYQDSQPVLLKTKSRMQYGKLPAIVATYKLRDSSKPYITLHIRVLMKDGWCIFLQLNCPDNQYDDYLDFIDSIKTIR